VTPFAAFFVAFVIFVFFVLAAKPLVAAVISVTVAAVRTSSPSR
jgi:hypothetical protein